MMDWGENARAPIVNKVISQGHNSHPRVTVLCTLLAISFLIIKITISSLVIGLKKVLFSTNSLAKLLSDSLLLDIYLIRRFGV